MAKEAKVGWQHHWVAANSLYKRRNRLYSQLSEARLAATAEHLLIVHLVGLSHCWHVLEANPAKPAEVFTLLLACLWSEDPNAHAKACDQMAAWFDSLSSQDDPELWRAIEAAFILSTPSENAGVDMGPISELIEQFPIVRSRAIEGGFLPSDNEKSASLKLLVEDHQVDSFLKGDGLQDGDHRNYCLALGLAAKTGDPTALEKLVSLESQYPDQVLPAYWLAATQPALEYLINALSVPHLAPTASQVWQVMTGQALQQIPAVGVAGKNKKAGPLMPDIEPAMYWWEQHRAESGPWLDGKPVDLKGLKAYLTQYCGQATQAVWWLLQYEQRRAMPDLTKNWHRYRVAQLQRGGLPNGSR